MSPGATCTGSCGVVPDAADRLLAVVARERREDTLAARLAPDMMPAGARIATAAGYTVRIAFPLSGCAVPDLPEGETAAALAAACRRGGGAGGRVRSRGLRRRGGADRPAPGRVR